MGIGTSIQLVHDGNLLERRLPMGTIQTDVRYCTGPLAALRGAGSALEHHAPLMLHHPLGRRIYKRIDAAESILPSMVGLLGVSASAARTYMFAVLTLLAPPVLCRRTLGSALGSGAIWSFVGRMEHAVSYVYALFLDRCGMDLLEPPETGQMDDV